MPIQPWNNTNQQGGQNNGSQQIPTQNPQNYLGDVFSKAKDIFKGVGSAVGGAVKAIAPQVLPVGGAILGGIGGEIAGAGVGGAAGEYADEAIANLFGARKSFSQAVNPKEIVTTGVASMAGQALGDVVFSKPAADLLIKGISVVAGYPETVVRALLQDPQNLVPGFKGGTKLLGDMVQKVSSSLGEQSGKLSDYYSTQLKPIAKNIIQGGSDAVDGLINAINKNVLSKDENGIFIQNLALPKGFEGVKIPEDQPGGIGKNLDFSKSTIVDKSAQAKINRAYNLIIDLKNNPTVGELNSLITKVEKLRDFDVAGGHQETAILGQMVHTINNFIHGANEEFQQAAAPALSALRNEVRPAQILLSNMRDIIPQKTNLAAHEIDATVKKLVAMIGDPYSKSTESAVSQYGGKIGEDIISNIKGGILKEKPVQGGIPVQSLMGIITKMIRIIPSTLLKIPVKIAGMEGLPGDIIRILVQAGTSEQVVRGYIQDIIQKDYKNK